MGAREGKVFLTIINGVYKNGFLSMSPSKRLVAKLGQLNVSEGAFIESILIKALPKKTKTSCLASGYIANFWRPSINLGME